MIELLACLALLAVLLAAGLPHLDARRGDINLSLRRLAADVRWTRARALGAGTHFALHVTGDTTYQIERLKRVGDVWEKEAVVRRVALPSSVHLADFSPDTVEFNTRGAVVFDATATPSPWLPRLVDDTFAAERKFAIWPSGQFHELP